MSKKYPGGFITKSPSTPTNAIATTRAPGIWTVEQATQLIQAGVWPNPANIPIETLFSTYIYTGTDSTLNINNGIDLAGQGGLVWIKTRSLAKPNRLWDTARGLNSLSSNTTGAQIANLTDRDLTSFNSNGFSLGMDYYDANPPSPMVSWTFRKAPKFFDVVTYTGNGTTNGTQAIAHSLGVTPGCIIIKRLDSTSDWFVYNVGSSINNVLRLNTTAAASSISWTSWGVTSTTFTPFSISGSPDANVNGATYVAYLFAHDTSTYGTIQCGSYAGNGSSTGPIVTLGWEPQWLLIKSASTATDWWVVDNMRGFTYDQANAGLQAQSSNAESSLSAPGQVRPLPTGFQLNNTGSGFNSSGAAYIYVAIRRGLMAPPTVGTNVFSPNLTTSSGQGATVSTGFPIDLQMSFITSGTSFNAGFVDRLRGINSYNNVGTSSYPKLTSSSDATEANLAVAQGWDNTGFAVSQALASTSVVYWNFRRAAGFFDEVCYTGTGSNTTVSHKLTVVPELMIVKRRNSSTGNWWVYTANLGPTLGLNLNSDASTNPSIASIWNSTAPTASVFSVGNNAQVNASSINYVAYLFATCPGASKVGSYTGNGSSQTIDCGFTTGARFIMIKRTDSAGNWWVWDTARGIVASFDPAAPINTTGGQASAADTIDPDNSGFIVNQEATINANVSGGSYIFFAVS